MLPMESNRPTGFFFFKYNYFFYFIHPNSIFLLLIYLSFLFLSLHFTFHPNNSYWHFLLFFLCFTFILLNVSVHLIYLWKDISKIRKKNYCRFIQVSLSAFNHSKEWFSLKTRWTMPYWLIVFNNVTMKTPLTLHHVMHNQHLHSDFPLHLKHLNELHYLRLKQRWWCSQHHDSWRSKLPRKIKWCQGNSYNGHQKISCVVLVLRGRGKKPRHDEY